MTLHRVKYSKVHDFFQVYLNNFYSIYMLDAFSFSKKRTILQVFFYSVKRLCTIPCKFKYHWYLLTLRSFSLQFNFWSELIANISLQFTANICTARIMPEYRKIRFRRKRILVKFTQCWLGLIPTNIFIMSPSDRSVLTKYLQQVLIKESNCVVKNVGCKRISEIDLGLWVTLAAASQDSIKHLLGALVHTFTGKDKKNLQGTLSSIFLLYCSLLLEENFIRT